MMDRLLDNFALLRTACQGLRAAVRARGTDQCTSFQYSRFTSHASQVNTSRKSTTHTPSARRAACDGSLT
jgi:hypothetical protein